jgi:hypothetical protein
MNCPLDNAVILDTEKGVRDTITIVCGSCGCEVDITGIEQREGKLVLRICCIVCEDFVRQREPYV